MSDKKYEAIHRNGENNGWWDVVFGCRGFDPNSKQGATRIAVTFNAVDEIKKFFNEAEHDSNCGGFKGWKCECWISKNKALFKTLEELNKLE